MTASTRRVPRQRPPSRAMPVRRPGIVYGINVVHPVTGEVVLGYVGKTRQQLASRERQHREEQPWADTIVGSAYVIVEHQGWSEAELDHAEQTHIRALKPIYNIDHNRNNPNRIPPWQAIEQRQAREAARGNPNWKPIKLAARPRSAWARWWRRRLPGLVVGAVLWLAAAAVLLWLFNANAQTAALGATVTVVVVHGHGRWWGRPRARRRRRGRRYRR